MPPIAKLTLVVFVYQCWALKASFDPRLVRKVEPRGKAATFAVVMTATLSTIR